MDPLELVNLTPLMARTSGIPEIRIGLIDGPVAIGHPDLNSERIREIPGELNGTCDRIASVACQHGTFVVGVLAAKRTSAAPAICPDCTLLVRPVFAETDGTLGEPPSATPDELGSAILGCIEAGARVVNVSAAISQPTSRREDYLEQALDHASRRGVIVVMAAGNQGTLGSTAITRHPGVIPVVAYDGRGRPTGESNFGNSIGKRGLGAPGDRITSLSAVGVPLTFGGTSAAAPFVTGAIALLWSEFPKLSAAQVRFAVTQASTRRRHSVVPPLLDAWAAYQRMIAQY